MWKSLILFGILLSAYIFGYVLSTQVSRGIADLKPEVFLYRKVFERNTSEPTNYTIIYKYKREELSGSITFVEFDISSNATGKIEFRTNVGPRRETIVEAKLNIWNGTNVLVIGKIYGVGGSVSTQLRDNSFLMDIMGDKLFEPKSIALVYAHNRTQTKNRYISLGERQPDDHLIKFERKHVKRTEFNNFPESEFMYEDSNTYLTHVAFTFTSSSAILFLNSSFIRENSFNAMVYDLNSPAFTATMSIYGYTDSDKPTKWKSIIP